MIHLSCVSKTLHDGRYLTIFQCVDGDEVKILRMCDKKCHLVDKHYVNLECDSTMYGKKFWRNRMCPGIYMRVRSIYSLALERSQIGAVNVVRGLKVGCLDWTVCQERK